MNTPDSSSSEQRTAQTPPHIQADLLGPAQPLAAAQALPDAVPPHGVEEGGVITPPAPADDENRPGYLGERHPPATSP